MVKEDMVEVEETEEDTEDRNNWRWKIRCGDADGKTHLHLQVMGISKATR